MKAMVGTKPVFGIPKLTIEKEVCQLCMLGKQTRKPFPQTTSYRTKKVFELFHSDLCGPITPSTTGKNRYIFVLIDDHSRYMWSILMKEKA